MSAPPGTTDEYSRKHRALGQDLGPPQAAPNSPIRPAPKAASRPIAERATGTPIAYSKGAGAVILVCALIGAAALVIAEFSTLYTVRSAGRASVVASTLAGTHNSYAVIPVAVLAVVLAVVMLSGRAGRWVPATLVAVGVLALLIGLLHDLPDAHRTGLLGSPRGHFVPAASSPGSGMYLETLGAVMLIVAGGLGLLFGEPGTRRAVAAPPAAGSSKTA